MGYAHSSFDSMEIFFLCCAIIGGAMVLIKIIMQFMGSGADTEVGGGGVDAHHANPDVGFKLLSIHGLAAFLMMFGLVGLALYRQNHAGSLIALAGAVAAGLASVWVIGNLFKLAVNLQSSGTLKTSDAVGSLGTVCLTIPDKGQGQVNINFRGRLREFEAMEKNGVELLTGTSIRVVAINANVLIVEKV